MSHISFDFGRSSVLLSFKPVGDQLHIARLKQPEVITVPRENVSYRVAKELDDSSTAVVDFGDMSHDAPPTMAIIAVGHESKLADLWNWMGR